MYTPCILVSLQAATSDLNKCNYYNVSLPEHVSAQSFLKGFYFVTKQTNFTPCKAMERLYLTTTPINFQKNSYVC